MKRVYKVIKSIRFIKSKVTGVLRTVFFGSYSAVKKCPVRNYGRVDFMNLMDFKNFMD